MKFTTLICVALTLVVVVHSEKYFSNTVGGDSITDIGSKKDVNAPTSPAFSSRLLKGSPFLGNYESDKTYSVVISAPPGFPVLAAIKLLDLRPNGADTLTLFVSGDDKVKKIFQNTKPGKDKIEDKNQMQTFFAYNGQLGVKFQTGPGSTAGYEGFELVYTAQANATCEHMFYFTCKNQRCIYKGLKCDGDNNCGDRSDEDNCSGIPYVPDDILPNLRKTAGQIAGIVCGVLFALIVVGGVIAFIIFRRASARRSTQGAVVGNAGYR